jgi:hypothetical protein
MCEYLLPLKNKFLVTPWVSTALSVVEKLENFIFYLQGLQFLLSMVPVRLFPHALISPETFMIPDKHPLENNKLFILSAVSLSSQT